MKGSKYWWLGDPQRHADTFSETFESLKNADLKVARAWATMVLFRDFWTYNVAGWAGSVFRFPLPNPPSAGEGDYMFAIRIARIGAVWPSMVLL